MKLEEFDSNVWKLCLIRVISNFMLVIPVIVLFFQENGLTMQQVFIVQVIFSITVIVLEVPSGYFSDQFGRKVSIVFGMIISFCGFFEYALAYDFWGFVVGEILMGIGCSFVSGSDEALLYDTLLEEKRESEFQKIIGLKMGLGLFSEGVASMIGGLLALISLRFPLYVEVFIFAFSIPIAISLREPKLLSARASEEWLNLIKRIQFCFYGNLRIRNAILYSSVVSSSTLVMFWLIQKYLESIDIPLGLFGIIATGMMFVSSFFSWKSDWITENMNRVGLLFGLWLMPIGGFLLLGFTFQCWSWIFIVLFYVTRGLMNPVLSVYINGLINSSERATILSVKNLVGRALFCLTGPVIGWMCDVFSLKIALFFSGAIFFLFGLILLGFVWVNKSMYDLT
ncbi:MFS transporter [Patescibacteria group bacterium]